MRVTELRIVEGCIPVTVSAEFSEPESFPPASLSSHREILTLFIVDIASVVMFCTPSLADKEVS